MCCPLGMCVALWCKSFEKFNIKSPKAPKHDMFVFFASVSKNFASLISTIVYNIIVHSYSKSTENCLIRT